MWPTRAGSSDPARAELVQRAPWSVKRGPGRPLSTDEETDSLSTACTGISL